MAERTIVVCDVCGKPATETVTIKVARGNYAKDLCAAHVTELVAGARRPRPGRPRKMAGETSVAVPKRRGRPRKAGGRKSTGRTRTATRKTTQTSGSPARSAKR